MPPFSLSVFALFGSARIARLDNDRFTEEDTAIDYFGEQLLAAGYNYYGNEPMYSGITGQEFAADIYIGVVYYQRLRHMVLDKFQVRTTGPIDPVTRQPVKVGSSIPVDPQLSAHPMYRAGNARAVSASERWSATRSSRTARRSSSRTAS